MCGRLTGVLAWIVSPARERAECFGIEEGIPPPPCSDRPRSSGSILFMRDQVTDRCFALALMLERLLFRGDEVVFLWFLVGIVGF